MIDVLKYTRALEEAGFEREQAELFVRGQVSMISDNVTTKADIDKLDLKSSERFIQMSSEVNERFSLMSSEMNERFIQLRSEMNEMATTLRSEMNEMATTLRSEMNEMATTLRSEMSQKLAEMETRLVLKISAIMAGQFAIFKILSVTFGI